MHELMLKSASYMKPTGFDFLTRVCSLLANYLVHHMTVRVVCNTKKYFCIFPLFSSEIESNDIVFISKHTIFAYMDTA